MRNGTRRALATACALGLAIPVTAVAVPTTIRVEGADATLVPERAVDVPESGTRLVTDSQDGDTITVPARSATAQLAATTSALGTPLAFDVFDFGSGPTSFVTGIGPDRMPPSFTPSWTVRVNHAVTQVGSDDVVLQAGDTVLWSFGDFTDAELDVTAPAAPVAAGTSFTVTVVSFDENAVATPAAGAVVTYGATTATTDAAGSATLVGDGAGPVAVTARRAGATRDSASVCSFPAASPEVCGGDRIVTTPPATVAVAAASAPLCRPLPVRESGSGDPARVRATVRTHVQIQRYATTVLRRVAAIEGWLDAGVQGSDLCGGALRAAAFTGVEFASGGTSAIVPPAPRPLVIPPLARAVTRPGPVTPAMARRTRTLTLTAMSRVNALEARLAGGLTGADVADGTIGQGQLAPGLVAARATAAPAPAPPAVTAKTVQVRDVAPTAAATRTDMRVAVAAIRRSADLVDRVRAGLTADQFAPGSIVAADLQPGVRP